MKKSLTLMLAIAMVFTMFASVAFAADATTTASSDAQTKFDALKAAGIMTGTVVDGQVVAGLDLNMDRASFAEVLVNLYGLTKEDVATPSFSDVPSTHWAYQQIEAVKKAGYMLGNGDGTFNPDGKITLQELASALCEANGLDPVANATVTGAADWAKGYVQAAIDAKLLLPVADYTAAATRADLVIGTYQTYQNVQAAQAPTATFAATGASQITVTFNHAVDSSKAAFAVKKNSIAVNNSSTTFAADNKSAVLTLATKLTAGDYTVSVTGLTDSALTGTVTVDDEKVAKIEFTTDKAALGADNSHINTWVKVYNQYNEDITSSKAGSLKVTSSKGSLVGSVTTDGLLSLDATPATYTLDEKVAVSVIDPATGTFASQTLTVAPKAAVATITIDKLVNTVNADNALQVNGDPAGNFDLVVTAKDQYGNDVAAGSIAGDVLVNISDSSIAQVAGYDSATGAATFSSVDVDGDGTNETVLTLANGTAGSLKAGTTQVMIVSKTTGNKATYSLTVKDKVKADTLSLSAPAIAVNGEKIEIPFTAVDTNGNAITDIDNLGVGASDSILSLSSTVGTISFEPDYVNNTAKLVLDTTGNPAITDPESVFINAVTSTGKSASLNITLQPDATPTVISGVTTDFEKTFAVDATQDLDYSGITVKDQYGRDYDMSTHLADYNLRVKTSDTAKVALSGATAVAADTKAITNTTDTVTFTADAKGASTITLSLYDVANSKDVDNSAYTFTTSVVEKDDIASYKLADIGTIYQKQTTVGTNDTAVNNAAHEVAVDVTGVLSGGSEVAIPSSYYTVTSSVYNSATGELNGSLADALTSANTTEDVPVIVTVDGKDGAVVLTKNATVSNAAPVATTLTLQDGTSVASATLESDGVISVDAGDVTNQTDINNLAADVVKTVDQYGVEITSSEFPAGNVIVTNISNSHTVTTLAAGDTANVTAITSNGKVVTFKLIVE